MLIFDKCPAITQSCPLEIPNVFDIMLNCKSPFTVFESKHFTFENVPGLTWYVCICVSLCVSPFVSSRSIRMSVLEFQNSSGSMSLKLEEDNRDNFVLPTIVDFIFSFCHESFDIYLDGRGRLLFANRREFYWFFLVSDWTENATFFKKGDVCHSDKIVYFGNIQYFRKTNLLMKCSVCWNVCFVTVCSTISPTLDQNVWTKGKQNDAQKQHESAFDADE